jgi:Glycosyltransferase Family 4
MMRVLLLRQQPCARARVHAVALSAAHLEIELGLARQGAPGGEGVHPEWQLGDRPARGLRQAIGRFAPDVIHSYGPAEWLTVCANELSAGRIPVIHDLSGQARGHEDFALERRAVEESDALVAPSPTLLEEIGSRHRLPPVTCVFPSYSLARELPADERHLSAEANIDRLASLYLSLGREPMATIAADLRSR